MLRRSTVAVMVAVFGCFLLLSPAPAAVVTWTASITDLNWGTAANWDAGVPVAGSDVLLPTPIPNPSSTWANPEIISLSAGSVANSLTFKDAYTLTGGDLALTAGTITVDPSIVATINSALGGSAGLTKDGNGTLVLGGVNTFSGAINVNAGILSVGSDDNLSTGSAAALNLDGTLKATNSFTTARVITPGSGGGTISVDSPQTLTLSAALAANANTLTVSGGGKLQLANVDNASRSGATIVTGGATLASYIKSGTAAVNALGTGAITLDGGTLELTPTANTANAGLSGRRFSTGSVVLGDTSRFDFTGTAASIRTDANLNIASGTTIPANTATQWTGKIKITTAGSYTFGTASDDGSRLFIDGVLIVNNDGGKGVIDSTNTITLSAGLHDIRVDHVNGSGSTGEILSYSGPDQGTYGFIPGGVLFQAETNTLSGASNAVVAGNNVNVTSSSTINLNGGDFTQVQIGNLTQNTGTTLTVGGLAGKTLRVGGTATLGNAAGTVTIDSVPDVAFDGVVTDSGNTMTIAKTNTGRLVFDQTAAANSLLATTTLDIQGGQLVLVGSTATGANNPIGSAKVQLNGAGVALVLDSKGATSAGVGPVYNNAVDVTQNATIQSVVNAATTTLGGATNGISIANGTTLTLDAIAGGQLTGPAAGDPGATLHIVGPITGSASTTLSITSTVLGSFAGASRGTVLLSGNNSGFTGSVTVNSGTLSVRNANSLNGNMVTLASTTAGLSYLFDAAGTAAPESVAFGTNVTLTANSAITVGRLGITYAPLYTQAANKTAQLGTLSIGANTLTITNNNGYSVDFTGAVTLTDTPTFSVANATSSSPMVQQGLVLSGLVSEAFGINKSGAGTLVLTNASNSFQGTINVSGAAGAGVLGATSDGALGDPSNGIVLNGGTGSAAFEAFGTFATSRTFTFSNATAANNQVLVSAGNTLTLNSVLTGANPFQKGDPGILVLNANNSGFSGAFVASGGITRVTNAGGLGTTAGGTTVANNSGTTLQFDSTGAGGSFTIAEPITLAGTTGVNSGGAIQNVGGNNTLSGLITLTTAASSIGADAGTTLTLTGGLSGAQGINFSGAGDINLTTTGVVTTAPTSLGKNGTGKLTVTADFAAGVPLTGVLTFNGGTVEISGAGKFGSTNTNIIGQNTTVILDNSGTNVNNRLNTRPTWFGGNLTVIGNASTATTETFGTNLQPAAGASMITLLPDAAQALNFGASGFSRNAGASLLLRGTNLGATPGSGVATAKFTTFQTAAQPVGQAGAAGQPNRAVTPWILVDQDATKFGQSFATYDATNGYQPLGAGETAATLVTNANVRTAAALTAAPGINLINSLTLDNGGGVSIGPSNIVRLDSGGLLAFAGNTGISGSTGVLTTTSNRELVVHVLDRDGTPGASLTIGSTIAGFTGGLIKADNGNLVLSAKNYYTGLTSVNGGMLTLNAGTNTLLPGQNIALNFGGKLDLNGNVQLVGDLLTNSTGGNETIRFGGNVTGSAGSMLVVNQSNTARTFGGSLQGAMTFVRGGQNTLTLVSDNTHTGGTMLLGGTTTLTEGGRLSANAPITIVNGTLMIDNNSGLVNNNDRVNDSATITLRTGQIQYKNRAQTLSSETMGALILAQGNNEINIGSAAGTGVNASDITFASITQSTAAYNGGTGLDATTNLQNDSGQVGSTTRTFFGNGVALLNNNILPVWIEHGGTEFVTYNATLGVMPLSAQGSPGYTGTTLPTVDNATSATGNYRIGANGVVPAGGLTVNTLNINGAFNVTFGSTTSTDVLNIGAGGLMKTGTTGTSIGSVVDEGRLTAGGASPTGTVPLHLFDGVSGNSFTINSRIVDNGASPIRVVVNNYNGGTVVLTNGANSYTGGTVVNGWTNNGSGGLRLGGAAGDLVIPAGGLTINNSTVTMANNGQINPANTVYMNGNATLTLVGANTLTALSFDNSGGTTNPTVATGGVLTLSAATPLVVTSNNVGSVATVAGTLDFGGNPKSLSIDSIEISGQVIAPLNASANITAVIQNAGLITKTGTGNLQLSAQNTFTGGVSVSNGGLIVGASSTPIAGTVVSGPIGTGTLTVANGKTLLASGAFTLANALTVAGDLNFAGVNNLTITGPIGLPTSPTINVDNPNMTAGLLGTITGAAGGITKTGLGTLALNSAYSGSIALPDGGALSLLTDGDGKGTANAVAGPASVASGGATSITVGRTAIDYLPYYPTASNKTIQIGGLSLGGNALGVVNNNGYGLENTGALVLSVNQVVSVTTATNSNVTQGFIQSGAISGAFGLIKQGAGALVLANNTNSFGGVGSVIDIQGGIVAAGSDQALGNANNSINLNIAGTTGVGLRATGTFSTARTINLAQATNAIEVTAGNTLTVTSPFTFAAAANGLAKNDNGVLEITANNPAWTGPITLNAGSLLASNSAVASPFGAGAITINAAQGAAVRLSGGVTVSNPLIINASQTLGGFDGGGMLQSISGNNTYSGSITQNSGNAATIGAVTGSSLTLTGTWTATNSIAFAGGGTINIQTAMPAFFAWNKYGSGTTVIAQANSAMTVAMNLSAGTTQLGGLAATSGLGSVGGTAAVTVNPGATLTIDNSQGVVANRLNGRTLTIYGGNLNLIGGASVTGEAIGAPTFNRGQSTITVTDGGAGTNLTFTAASNNVNPAQSTGGSMATALFRGTSLGTVAGPGVATIQSTTGGINFNGQTGGAGTTTKGIMPWAIIDTSTTGLGFSFATADTTTSILRPLAANEYSNTAALVVNTNALINTASGSITNQNTIAPNSLTFDNSTSITMNAGQTLSLSSGGILVRNGSTSSISGGIASQPNSFSGWNVHTVGTAALTISSLMNGGQAADRGGLVKAGGGTLTLSTPKSTIGGLTAMSANTLNMQTVVNQGTLKLDGGTNVLGVNRYLEVGPGGELDLNGNAQVVQGLYTDGTINGIANTVTAGGTIKNTAGTQATLVTNSDARNWSGEITGNVFYNRNGTATVTAIYTPQTYTGGTLINGGTVTLRDYGALTGTSAVDINYAWLNLDNTQAADVADRVGNTIPITLRGGNLTYLGRAQTASAETLGAISLAEGLNVVDVQNGGTGINSAVLTVASLTRPAGSAAVVILGRGSSTIDQNGQIGSTPRMLITAAPSLSNNIIGPWAIIRRDWAGYIPGLGVGQLNATGFAGYATSTLTGSPLSTDNIKITTNASNTLLTGDTTVNTLNITTTATGATVDLGGFQLTLAGGGLMLGLDGDSQTQTISNGTLTSGYANGLINDLYIYHGGFGGNGTRQGVISAVIADNGATPVRLVLTSDVNATGNRLTLSGVNTYSGGTVVNGGSAAIGATGVVPAGGITLNAGILHQAITAQLVPGAINSANVVTLDGPSTLNLANDNTLAGLVFNNNGSTSGAGTPANSAPTVNTFVAGAGTAGTGTLTIGASGIVANSSNVQTLSIIQGRIDTGAGGNTLTVNPVLVNGVNVSPLHSTLAITGWTGSAGDITKAGSGNLQLNAPQTFTGDLNVTAGGINIGFGSSSGLSGTAQGGSRYSALTLNANTWLNLAGQDATIGSLAGSGTVINLGATNNAASLKTLNVGFDDSNTTFSGSVARWSDVLPAAIQVNKIGAGTMTLTGVSTSTGTLQVSQGGVTFSGAGAGVFGVYAVIPTGTLTLDNATTNVSNRLGGATNLGTLQVSGGTLKIIGNAGAATSETIGTLSFNATTNPGGPSTITLQANAAQPLTLTVGTAFTAITSGAYDSGLIRGVSATAGNGLANLSIGSIGLGAATGAGTGANGTTTMPIRPDLLGDASPTGVGTGFITKDSATNFLRPLTAGELANTVVSGASNGTANYGLATNAGLGAGGQFGSLTLNSGGGLQNAIAVATPDGLPINPQVVSGGVLAFSGNAGITAGRLQTANNFAFQFHTVGNLTVNSVLYGTTGGLVKSDAGTLTLNAKALYTGQTNVNGGTLVLNAGENTLPVLATGGVPTVLSTGVHSGTLDLNGNSQIIASLFNNGLARYAGNGGTFTNTSLTAATLTANTGVQIFGGTIAGNLNFTKNGNALLTLTSPNTYTGVTNIRASTLTLLDGGTLANTSAININYAGLTLDNTGLNPVGSPNLSRVPAAAPITLRVGTLTYTPGHSYDYAQSLGTVNVSQGHNTISLTQAPISSTGALTIGNLVLDPDATLNVVGGNNSGFFSSLPGMNISNLFITQLNSVAIPANITGKILPANIVTNNGEFTTYIQSGTTGSNGQNWGIVTMNGGAGTQSNYDATTIAAGSNPTVNVRISGTGTQTIGAGGAIVNVVAVRAALTNLNFTNATDVLNLNAGGLALTNGGTTVSATANTGVITAGGTPGTGGGTARLYIHNTGTNTVNSTIANNTAGSGNIVRLVANVAGGTLTLGGTNTYTGGTVVNGGATLALSATGIIPAGGLTINGTTVTATTALNQIASANDVTINGGGVLTLGAFANALNSITFNNIGGAGIPTVTIGATSLALTATNAITSVNDNTGTVPTIAGTQLILPSGANITTSGLAPTSLSITAPISSLGVINKEGSGSLFLNAASTFAGGVNLNAGAIILGVGSTGTPPTLTNGPLGTGTLTMANGTSLISDTAVRTIGNAVVLNGDITFGSTAAIANASTIDVNGVTLSGTVNLGGATRTINVNSFRNTSTISGIVSNTTSGAGLTKTGPGTLVLSAANTFDGPVTINGGVLSATLASSLGAGTGAGNITFGGGILQHGSTNVNDYSSRFSTANNQAFLIDTVANNVTYATALTSATSGSLGKFGTGTLILTAAADYDGATIINAGTLQVSTGTSAGNIPANTNIYDSGTLYMNRAPSDTNVVGFINGSGGVTIGAGTLKPTATSTLGGALTFGASANGTSTVGTLDLTAADATFGSLLVQNSTSSGGSAIALDVGRTLSINGNVVIGPATPTTTQVSKLSISGGGSLVVNTAAGGLFQVGGSTTGTSGAAGNNAQLDLAGLSSVSINVSATGTVRVNNPQGGNTAGVMARLQLPTPTVSDVTPVTTITAGNLNVGDNGANGAGAGQVNAIVLGTGLTSLNVNTVNVGTGGRDFGQITFAGSGGTIKLRAADGSGRTALNIGTGTANTGVAPGAGVTNNVDFRGHSADLLLSTLTIGGQNRNTNRTDTFAYDLGTVDVTTVIVGTNSGTANTTAGSNTWTSSLNIGGGTTTVGTGGMDIAIGSTAVTGTDVIAASVNISGGAVTVANNTTLNAAIRLGTNSVATGLTANGTLNLTGGTLTVAGDIIKGGGAGAANAAVILAGGTLDMSGNDIGGATAVATTFASGTLKNVASINGAGGLTKTTTGTLILDGTNTYTGDTAVNAGMLLATKPAALPGYNASKVTPVAATATLAVRAGTASDWLSADVDAVLGATGAAFAANSNFGIEVLTPNSFTYANDLGATVVGKGFVKLGAGALTLNGASTYTGPTDVQAGTLLAKNTTGSATGTGAVSISAGAMLGGNGTIAGNTTVNGTLDPGDLGTAGNLKFGGNLILGTGATSVFRLATAGYDQVSGINALTYGGTLNVLLDSGAVTGAGAYTLFGFTSYTGAFTTVGTMPTLPSGYAWKDYGTNDYFNEATGQIEVISLGPLTRVWNGGAMSDANWNAASNWGVTGLPATNTLRDKLVFAGSTQTTNTNNIAGLIVGGIKFTGAADPDGHPAAGAFILNGPNGVTIEGKIDNQSATAAQTINLDVTFAAGTDSGTLNVVSGGSLELAGAVNSTLGLTKTGLGTAKLSASTGTTYSGPTLVNEGTLEVTKGINLVADTDDTTVGTSTTTATLITEHIRQDVLTINAGSKVKISATGGASSTSVVNVLNIANASGSFSWSVPGGDISPAATGGPVASGAAVPEPATWLLAVIAALAGLVAWRRRK